MQERMSDAEMEAALLLDQMAESARRLGPDDAAPVPGNIVDWCERNVVIGGRPFSLRNRPFLRDIYEDRHPRIVVMKSTQIGVTELAIRKAQHFVAHIQGNVIYTMPSATDVEDFAQGRWTPSLEESPKLMALKGDLDNVGLKRFGKGFIYFRGTWTERQAISIPAEMCVHDEVDFSKPGTVNMFRSRLDNSSYKIQLLFSTPTQPGFGIEKIFRERSDQRHWHIECPHCRHSFALCCAFPEAVHKVEACPHPPDRKRMAANGFKHYFGCPECKGELTPEDRVSGEWIAARPEQDWHGYHPTSMLAPWWTADDIISARDEYEQEKDFYNLTLGQAYAHSSQQVTKDMLDGCIDGRMQIRSSAVMAEQTTMGVDQGDELYVVISKWNKRGQRQVIYANVLGIKTGFKTLRRYMKQFKVRCCVIDALPNHLASMEFAANYPGKVWCAHYVQGQRSSIAVWKPNPKEREWQVNLNRTDALQQSLEQIINDQLRIPKSQVISDQFIPHVLNLRRLESQNAQGDLVAKYVSVGPDHMGHANSYDIIARSRLGRTRGIRNMGAGRSVEPAPIEHDGDGDGKKPPLIPQKDRILGGRGRLPGRRY